MRGQGARGECIHCSIEPLHKNRVYFILRYERVLFPTSNSLLLCESGREEYQQFFRAISLVQVAAAVTETRTKKSNAATTHCYFLSLFFFNDEISRAVVGCERS